MRQAVSQVQQAGIEIERFPELVAERTGVFTPSGGEIVRAFGHVQGQALDEVLRGPHLCKGYPEPKGEHDEEQVARQDPQHRPEFEPERETVVANAGIGPGVVCCDGAQEGRRRDEPDRSRCADGEQPRPGARVDHERERSRDHRADRQRDRERLQIDDVETAGGALEGEAGIAVAVVLDDEPVQCMGRERDQQPCREHRQGREQEEHDECARVPAVKPEVQAAVRGVACVELERMDCRPRRHEQEHERDDRRDRDIPARQQQKDEAVGGRDHREYDDPPDEDAYGVRGVFERRAVESRVGVEVLLAAHLRPGGVDAKGRDREQHVHEPDTEVLGAGPGEME